MSLTLPALLRRAKKLDAPAALLDLLREFESRDFFFIAYNGNSRLAHEGFVGVFFLGSESYELRVQARWNQPTIWTVARRLSDFTKLVVHEWTDGEKTVSPAAPVEEERKTQVEIAASSPEMKAAVAAFHVTRFPVDPVCCVECGAATHNGETCAQVRDRRLAQASYGPPAELANA